MRIEEFAPEKAWWGGAERSGRVESEQAWKVSVEQIKANGYNLDIKNPNTVADVLGDPDELLALAGRTPSDLADIIKRAPVEVSALLRTTSGMTRDEIAWLAEEARKVRGG